MQALNLMNDPTFFEAAQALGMPYIGVNLHVVVPQAFRVALPALRHRLILNYEAEAKGVTTDRVVGELLAAVPEEG